MSRVSVAMPVTFDAAEKLFDAKTDEASAAQTEVVKNLSTVENELERGA